MPRLGPERILPTIVLLAACGSPSDVSTGAPPHTSAAASIVVVSGGSQQAFPGDTLADRVRVQVVDARSARVAGRFHIRFTITGGGSVSDTNVTTADDGSASTAWKLGSSVGSQQLTATLADLSSSAPTQILAEALSPSAADLVVVHGSTKGIVGIVVRQDNFTWTYTLTWPDTILRLLPHEPVNDGPAGSASWQEVTAFSYDHPPATALHPWTTGRDTVHLVLRPPVEVAFTAWVSGAFDTTAVRVHWDLANVDGTWRGHMTGLRVGSIQIRSAPGLVVACGQRPAQFDPKAVNLYYLDTPVDGLNQAHTCDATTVVMPLMTPFSMAPINQMTMSHELGHAMGLIHLSDESNMMSGDGKLGGGLYTGQIYWMYFHSSSAINAVMGTHPVGERNCDLPLSAHCPPQTFAIW